MRVPPNCVLCPNGLWQLGSYFSRIPLCFLIMAIHPRSSRLSILFPEGIFWLDSSQLLFQSFLSGFQFPKGFLLCFHYLNLWLKRDSVLFKEGNIMQERSKGFSKAVEFWAVICKPNISKQLVVDIWWFFPYQWLDKLNADGASRGNPGKAGSAGIIRSEKGEWVVGCCRGLGVTSNFIAELSELARWS